MPKQSQAIEKSQTSAATSHHYHRLSFPYRTYIIASRATVKWCQQPTDPCVERERERDVSPLESSLLSTSRTRSPSRLLILTPDHQRWPLVAGTSINAFTVVLCADVIQMGFVFAKRFVVLVLFASITLTPPSTPSSNPLQG